MILNVDYGNKLIEEVEADKFFAHEMAETNWKGYIECIIPKLSCACFSMSIATTIMKIYTLKLVYLFPLCVIFWRKATG
jgi:hypothetical protein